MIRPHMRPRLKIVVDAPIDEVRAAFEDRVAHPTCTCEGRFARNHLHVEVGADRKHFWSPTLDVDVRETDQGTVLKGRFAPHPNVWTLYVFGYAVCAFVAIVAGCYAIAQYALGWPLQALWVVAGALLAWALLFLSGRLGARLGHDQMEDLVQMIEGLGQPAYDEAHVVHDELPPAAPAPASAE